MAEMHPADIENYNYTLSEKYVYEAFRDQLEKKYHVFYSVRWFEVEEGKRVDSESDFIVFDPSFGFIISYFFITHILFPYFIILPL